MKPFLKALQSAAYAAEAEASSKFALAAALRDQADALEEAVKTMRTLDKLQAQKKNALAATSISVHTINALMFAPTGKRVKLEEAPAKVWGCAPPPKPAEVTRTQFCTGVMKVLATGRDDLLVALGDALQEKVDLWFSHAAVACLGEHAALNPNARVDVAVVLQNAKSEAAEATKQDESRQKELLAVHKRAREQQRTILMEEEERKEREEEARSASNASRAAALAAASFNQRGFENADELAGVLVPKAGEAGQAKVVVRKK